MPESVSSLYRALLPSTSTTTHVDTYEKERLQVLIKLNLVPDHIIRKTVGKNLEYDRSKAGLGLFARNRRNQPKPFTPKGSGKSEREITGDAQNNKKRLLYNARLNNLVSQMGVHLNTESSISTSKSKPNSVGEELLKGGEIPSTLWSKYDRLQNDPTLRLITKDEMALGGVITPGPGEYNVDRDLRRGGRGGDVKVSERWKSHDDYDDDRSRVDSNNTTSPYKTSRLSQTKGSPWQSIELHDLNKIYHQLGHKPSHSTLNEHLKLYAQYHRVLYCNRGIDEVVEKVRWMLCYNGFKEEGEAGFWKNRKRIDDAKRGVKENSSTISNSISKSIRMVNVKDGQFTQLMNGSDSKNRARVSKSESGFDDDHSEDEDEDEDEDDSEIDENSYINASVISNPNNLRSQSHQRKQSTRYLTAPLPLPKAFETIRSTHQSSPAYTMQSRRPLPTPPTSSTVDIDQSSLGVQILSEKPTSSSLSFKRHGQSKVIETVDEANNNRTPGSTTYSPKTEYIKPRSQRNRVTSRLPSVATDVGDVKFSTYRGPGIYDVKGSLGRQVESLKRNTNAVAFGSSNDAMKYLSVY